MLREGQRNCDLCGGEIPQGTKYLVATLRPEAASMLAQVEADLKPSWTKQKDGLIRLDICHDCHMKMDGSFDSQEVH